MTNDLKVKKSINDLPVLPKIVYTQYGLIKILIIYKFPIKDNY